MPAITGTHFTPYGLKQCKIYRAGTTVRLFASQTVTITPTGTSNTLRGDNKIYKVNMVQDGGEFTIEQGGISLEALSLIYGYTVTSGYNATEGYYKRAVGTAAKCVNEFRLLGKAQAKDCADEVHFVVYRCIVTEPGEITFSDGEFVTSPISGICLPREEDDEWWQMTQYDRTVTLPSS